mmetsp:Transcript_26286/g.44746  ORF Transcript_26286/g.44746 Transcript_26286/m.44746 type:complete len:83 (+) Transcript_26286:25-273(+)
MPPFYKKGACGGFRDKHCMERFFTERRWILTSLHIKLHKKLPAPPQSEQAAQVERMVAILKFAKLLKEQYRGRSSLQQEDTK